MNSNSNKVDDLDDSDLNIENWFVKNKTKVTTEPNLDLPIAPEEIPLHESLGNSEISDPTLNIANSESESHHVETSDKKISTEVGEVVKFVKFVKPSFENDMDRGELLESSPLIPDGVFEALPSVLRDAAAFFDKSKRQRDVFLTGAIGVLSGCFPKVFGIYDKQKVFSNLNAFIAAPPASGKGALSESLKLCGLIHKLKRNEGKELAEKYKLSDKKSDSNSGQSPYIPEKLLVIPGNSSYSAIVKCLNDNDGVGIICETEADTLNNVLKQDWGNYSEMIRNAAHHETIRQQRLTTGYVEIRKPKLSVILSGTINQLLRFIPSTEDGLFSRFLYYIYAMDPHWLDPSPGKESVSSEEYFLPFARFLLEAYKFHINKLREFTLEEDQWHHLNNKFSQLTDDLTPIGQDISSIVFRLGLFQFRLAMLFSILRNSERKIENDLIRCDWDDYLTASHLVDIYISHSMIAYKLLPKAELRGINSGCKTFYNSLPANKIIKRKDAVEIGSDLTISEGSVDKYLKRLLTQGMIESPLAGSYIKVVQE